LQYVIKQLESIISRVAGTTRLLPVLVSVVSSRA